MTKGAGPRLGMVVSRKVGPAVVRNQLKRWIREWFRRRAGALPAGLDIVVIPRPDASRRGHGALDQDLEQLIAGMERFAEAGETGGR